MALNYDFDMFSPGANDPALTPGRMVALFREPTTVAAVGRSPQAVQDYLRASNFGLGVHRSGAPAGRYPAADEAARIAVIEALAENVALFDLPRADDMQPAGDAFHLPSFFAAVAEAEPIRMEAEAPVDAPMAVTEPVQPVDAAAPVDDAPFDYAAFVEDAAAVEDPAPVAASAGHPAGDALPSDTVTIAEADIDALIARAVGQDAAAADPGPGDALPAAPVVARRFSLPMLSRWLTRGAAVAVLGVAFSSAML